MTQTSLLESLERYQAWLQDPAIDEDTKQELRSIEGQDKEIEDRFFKELAFGTGGLRGVIGAGLNRMNKYIVGRASQGLAQHVLGQPGTPSVAIAYDSRNQSPEFALEAALVLAGNGVKAYVFESLRPTPELSFAVRELKATAGIVVTASHNPPEYNGYKVYGADGGQIVAKDAENIISHIASVGSFADIKRLSRDEAEAQGLLQWIGDKIDDAYIQAVTSVSLNKGTVAQISDNFKIVYTPLHGAGNQMVRRSLKEIGFKQVIVVPEQEQPDSQFSTVASPNPEEREAFKLALALAEQHEADIVIGTDPDCDRMGAVVKNPAGEYFVLSGNQSGAIMAEYLLSSHKERGTLPDNAVLIKTIVTSEMGASIASHYGVTTLNTLTGFKYIGEKMTQFEKTGEHAYMFGYEESYGYLAGTHCRDKDAVVASMLICEAAAYYKSKGQTLYDVLQALYARHGYFQERLISRTLKGKEGIERIGRIMEDWRQNPPTSIQGIAVEEVLDYSKGIEGLPQENVLKYKLADQSWFCLRPSGTEPKIKVYFAVCGDSNEQATSSIEGLVTAVMERTDQVM